MTKLKFPVEREIAPLIAKLYKLDPSKAKADERIIAAAIRKWRGW